MGSKSASGTTGAERERFLIPFIGSPGAEHLGSFGVKPKSQADLLLLHFITTFVLKRVTNVSPKHPPPFRARLGRVKISFGTTGAERERFLILLYDRGLAGAMFHNFYTTGAARERFLTSFIRQGPSGSDFCYLLYDRGRAGAIFYPFYTTGAKRERILNPFIRQGPSGSDVGS